MHGDITTMGRNVRRRGIKNSSPEYVRSIFEGPTEERLQKAQGHFQVGDDKQGTKVYRMRDDTLARMLDRDAIDGTEYAALQKYKHHWTAGGLMGSVGSVDLNRVFSSDPASMSGMAKSEGQAHHRGQFRRAREQLGNRQVILVERVVLEEWTLESAGGTLGWRDRKQAVAAATEMLRDAGYRLAKLWGM